MQSLSREKFEDEYRRWIKYAAKDVAFALNQLKPDEIKNIIAKNEQYLEKPESVFGTDGLGAIKKFAPPNIVLLSTDAVVFSQSIFAPLPGVFDYAGAMNRRYYLGSWYSIITLNTAYLKEASETVLKYVLFHEMFQKEVYEENMRTGIRKFTPEEKRKISKETLNRAIEMSGITPEELSGENELMLRISWHSPLLLKPFAETALYWYMERNLEEFRQYAEASKNEKEDTIGKKLNSDFKDCLDFSTDIYRTFLTDVKKELNYMDYGYT
ncbi:MAG: hypothetical protein PHU34_08800 [Candidatus Methanoperedens sp.]|nr:hypothetical protein [Candidatus Methanoperedens sp.]